MVETAGPGEPRRRYLRLNWLRHIGCWLVWLVAVDLWSYILFYHLAVLNLFRSASLSWWPYVLVGTGLLAYASSLLPVANRSFLFILTILLFAGAAGAFLIGAPFRPGPPWYLFEVPFDRDVEGPLHDRYFGDDEGLSVFGMYGFGPVLILVVLAWRAVQLLRGLSPWPRRSISALSAVAFFILAAQVADRIASAWLMARYVDYLMSREPAPLVDAARTLLRHPLCRTSCTQRVCQIGWVLSQTDQSLLREFLKAHQAQVCRDPP